MFITALISVFCFLPYFFLIELCNGIHTATALHFLIFFFFFCMPQKCSISRVNEPVHDVYLKVWYIFVLGPGHGGLWDDSINWKYYSHLQVHAQICLEEWTEGHGKGLSIVSHFLLNWFRDASVISRNQTIVSKVINHSKKLSYYLRFMMNGMFIFGGRVFMAALRWRTVDVASMNLMRCKRCSATGGDHHN